MISLHQFFEILCIIGLFVGAFVMYVVASCKPSQNQKRMLLICGAAIVIYLGNFFSLFSTEFEALVRAHQLKTIGHILLLTSFILFMSGFCNINLYRPIKIALIGFNFVCVWACITGKTSAYFYDKFTYVSDEPFPYIEVDMGIMYIMCRMINFIFILVLSGFLVKGTYKKDIKLVKRNMSILAGTIMASVGDLITSFDIIPGYDFIAFGITICFGFMIIAIYKYGALDTMEVAKEKLLEEIEEGLIVVDVDKKLVYANSKARRTVPYVDSDSTEFSEEKIKAVFEDDKFRVVIDDEQYEAKISKLEENGVLRGYMAWLFDVSFINRYTKEILELKEIAEAANHSKSTFLANMSHEIRTPMNAIVGFNELIIQKSHEKEIVEYASDIKTASNNLLTIINDILDLSKIESGKIELVETDYNIVRLIDESILNIRKRAKDKGLEFILDIDNRLPCELYGDDKCIRNVLINLLTNAVKYTNSGFIKLIVALDGIEDDMATIRFCVADSGIGIKEEDMPRLFNKFKKFDSKRNSGIEGTGLGLTIVKGYTQHLGGTISVESEYAMGSTFTVVLPQKIVNYARLEEVLGHEHIMENDKDIIEGEKKYFKAPNAKILVVDDNAINLKVSASLLGTYGINADVAESGMAAIEKCKDTLYDIIFMDHMMPEMDGVEAMKRIRRLKDSELYKSCIVALTANAIVGVKEMMLKEGFDGYLSKPIDITYLEEILLNYLPKELVVYVEDEAKLAGNEKDECSFEECLSDFEIDKALNYCGGDMETLKEIMCVYYEVGESRIADFERFLHEKDYKNYIISVHGLKSSSASIGAMELSDKAKQHELSGKDGNYEFLHDDLENLIDLYKSALSKIEKALINCGKLKKPSKDNIIDEQQSEKETGTESNIKEGLLVQKVAIAKETEKRALKGLTEMLEISDYGGIRRLIKELKTCRLSDDTQKNIDNLEMAVDMERFDELLSVKEDILRYLSNTDM